MQRLYLLRHGEASDGYPDHSRQLNPAGRSEVLDTLEQALKRIEPPVQIFHSGLVRARQTAELAAQVLGAQSPQRLDGIDPGGNPAELCDQDMPAGDLMLVTHNPFVESLAWYLAAEELRIRTGSLVALELEYWGRGCAELLWQLK